MRVSFSATASRPENSIRYETRERLIDVVKTGDIATVDFDNDTIEINGKVHQMKPMGDVRPVIEAGGLFNYARKSGMIPNS